MIRRSPRFFRPILIAALALAAAVVVPRNGVHASVREVVAASVIPSGAVHRLPRMTIARLHYDGGGDWYANPSSLPNLLTALAQRTSLPIEREPAEVRLTDDQLWDYPVLHATGHGEMKFSDAEIVRLREYLERGGFLHVDDNYGLDASFRREIWDPSRSGTRRTCSVPAHRRSSTQKSSSLATLAPVTDSTRSANVAVSAW